VWEFVNVEKTTFNKV